MNKPLPGIRRLAVGAKVLGQFAPLRVWQRSNVLEDTFGYERFAGLTSRQVDENFTG